MRLLIAAGLGNSLPLRAAHAALSSADDAPSPLPGRLSILFTAKESARKVGRRYLQRFPHEADVHRLTLLICRSERRRARLARVDAPTMRNILAKQQRQDFRNRRIVAIDGWMLSETEARLCAIAALI